jgi:bifunctional ADP-heptose synthase (sugar kinase/adenylyltransferase)
MVLRVDEHDYCERVDKKVLEGIRNNKCKPHFNDVIEVDAIIISDYCKGFLEEDDIQFICENNDNVFVDTKKKLGKWIEFADFIKINELEYKKNHELLSDNGFREKLIVTLGSKGCRWNGKEFPVEEVPVKDVSGAGDTFLAGLVRGYLDTNNIEEAIKFAQKCTTIVVQKHGVATVGLREIQNG